MIEAYVTQIKGNMLGIEYLRHRLILVIGESGSGKTKVLEEASKEIGVKVNNLNLILSASLLDYSSIERALLLPRLLEKILTKEENIFILDNTEILFDKGLKQDPLRLLQGLSRNRTIIASWCGHVKKGKLVYAEPGHAEYRAYDVVDFFPVLIGQNF